MAFVREYQYQRINGYFNCNIAALCLSGISDEKLPIWGLRVETGRKSVPWWVASGP